jgi:ubiquinone/menaquinone biosynthesis C-methylase UbiE
LKFLAFLIFYTVLFSIGISLLVSFYVYDVSSLYKFKFLPNFNSKKVLNITAGFDETSPILKNKFPEIDLTIVDFYDETKHTEISIKRARKAYPKVENTHSISTHKIPFPNNYFDYSVAIFSAHEIRNDEERMLFFKEINRVTKPNGQLFVTEHHRDFYNFLAYNIGFFHFHTFQTWSKTFKNSGFIIKDKIKTTAFVTTYILEKNGNTP